MSFKLPIIPSGDSPYSVYQRKMREAVKANQIRQAPGNLISNTPKGTFIRPASQSGGGSGGDEPVWL